ncbi:MAG: bifunctional riboflavin kinase/FAD synthetase [Sulfurospirillum sp.]|nr:bifunctional riboflavin kinase/FAD synthetase [Sulfurospirillum sp.]MBL0703510.1 bifunctional riboflavin kinase/FAD synthetase [Sulfurospirillum sp.]
MKRPFTILQKHSIDTIAIGSFDGIHLGHMQLIDKLGNSGALFIIDRDDLNLISRSKQIELAKHTCLFYDFLKIKNLSGEEFIEFLKKEFINLKKIIVGYDFLFGKQRSCNATDLIKFYDGEVDVIEEFFYDGVSVHSSMIRDLLTCKKIERVNIFLGREYSIYGKVIKGQGLGKRELYPTINIHVKNYTLPSDGVYASRTKIDSKIYDSISFIGTRVSTDKNFSIETHIINRDIEACDEVEIFFVCYLRENKKFDNLIDLKTQISIDINNSKSALKTQNVHSHG